MGRPFFIAQKYGGWRVSTAAFPFMMHRWGHLRYPLCFSVLQIDVIAFLNQIDESVLLMLVTSSGAVRHLPLEGKALM